MRNEYQYIKEVLKDPCKEIGAKRCKRGREEREMVKELKKQFIFVSLTASDDNDDNKNNHNNNVKVLFS